MESNFYIQVHVKTPEQLQTIGKFFIGNDRQFTHDLFNRLKGRPFANKTCVLCLELVETLRDLPVNIEMLACTLDELTENYRIITRELFRQLNLEEPGNTWPA